MTAVLFLLSMTAVTVPSRHQSLVQFDQAHVPTEPDPSGSADRRVNVTGLVEWLSDTNANTFSFFLWDVDGHEYLDFVRVLSLTANVAINGTPLRIWLTLIPPTEARGSPLACSVAVDSPLTPFNETALFNASRGNHGCLDYVGWGGVIGRLGRMWPHLEAVTIDDFSANLVTFTETYVLQIRAALAGSVRLIPTFYYGHHFAELPWLFNLTDGVLFYFRNDRDGQAACAANSSYCAAAWKGHSPNGTCNKPCLLGTCAEASLPNLPGEIADFVHLLPNGHPLHVGLYMTGYTGCAEAPSAHYTREALATALALPSVAGVTVYTFQHPAGGPSACDAPGPAPDADDKGCIVRKIFGEHASGVLGQVTGA
jgi:predicted lipoprotein with Yx(FWY)xxD motif